MEGQKKMKYSTRDYQARLKALGYNPGPIDGVYGSRTKQAIKSAMVDRGVNRPEKLIHKSGLHRIHIHWTGGAYGDIALERSHYHLIILEDGKVVMGDLRPESNANTTDGSYMAHTRMANSGAIGVAVDAMGGAQESPFNPGRYPITWTQMDSLAVEVADLADTYDIPITRYSVLTHAEVQPTLGIRQRWKWDITWLPGMVKPGDPIEVGDKIRKMIRDV